ncbi:hypothetical protein Tco_1077924 [Tanacetum coccineum]
MENEHELSYETLTRVYLGSYEHYKSVGAEVEYLEPGFELQGAKMVEMGRSYGSKGLLPYGFERGDGWIADVGGLVCRFDVLEGLAAAAAVLGKRRGHVASFLAMERSKLLAGGFGCAGVMPAGLTFSTGGVSDIWWGIVMTIISAMSSMMSCACVPRSSNDVADEVYGVERACCDVQWPYGWPLNGRNASEKDSEFARRVGVLFEEMEAAYKEWVDFIKELEAVSGVDAAVETAEFLKDVLWKDERRLQRLCKLRMDADLMAYDKKKFAEKW